MEKHPHIDLLPLASQTEYQAGQAIMCHEKIIIFQSKFNGTVIFVLKAALALELPLAWAQRHRLRYTA